MTITKSTSTNEALSRKRRYLVPCVGHFYQEPPVFLRGQGMTLVDAEGMEYLDFFSGVSVNHLGHCHPEVTAAIRDQAGALCHTTTIYLTEPMLDLAEALIELAPAPLAKVYFCASGSEANESAAFFARAASGRPGMLAFDHALHGNTKMAQSLTGLPFWKTDPEPVPQVAHAPSPYCYRCPLGKNPESCRAECLNTAEQTLQDADGDIGTVFLEVVHGNGGILVPPAQWTARLKQLIDDYGLLLVVDEVQTAFGRTGKMFASEHFDLKPDLMSLAKALGGGLPMGATLASDAVADAFQKPRASTFGGNLVAARAGLAAVRVIRDEALDRRSAALGDYFMEGLESLQKDWRSIGDVRGLGLMIGAELVDAEGLPDSQTTDRVLERLKDEGFIVGKSGPGRNVLTFLPPLIVKTSDIDALLAALHRALSAETNSWERK